MSSSNQKSIFITGAASGMGRATAIRFAREGWLVGAYDLNARALQSLREELSDSTVLCAELDVTDAAAFKQAIAGFGEATGGKLDLLFNNAGIGVAGMFDEVAWPDLMKVVNINLVGVMIGIRAAVPLLRETHNALCLTNSSSSAIFGTAGIAVYSATKHAVRGLTEALAIEFQRFGVRAADLLPGLVDTPILTERIKAMAPPDGMWRLVQPAEVADVVWSAYHGDRLHWYVPEDLKAFDLQATKTPEGVLAERAAMSAFKE